LVISGDTIDKTQTTECILTAAHVFGPIFLKNCDNQFSCAIKAVDGTTTFEITRETDAAVHNVASKAMLQRTSKQVS